MNIRDRIQQITYDQYQQGRLVAYPTPSQDSVAAQAARALADRLVTELHLGDDTPERTKK